MGRVTLPIAYRYKRALKLAKSRGVILQPFFRSDSYSCVSFITQVAKSMTAVYQRHLLLSIILSSHTYHVHVRWPRRLRNSLRKVSVTEEYE